MSPPAATERAQLQQDRVKRKHQPLLHLRCHMCWLISTLHTILILLQAQVADPYRPGRAQSNFKDIKHSCSS